MSILSRVRILTKILTVIVLLSLIAAGIAYLGITGLKTVADNGNVMKRSADRALDAARMNQNVLAINRAEFRIGMEPTPEAMAAAHKVIDEQIKQYQSRLEDVSKTTDEEAQKLLGNVKQRWADYQRDLQDVVKTAADVKNVQMTEEVVRLRDTVMTSRAAAEQLEDSVRAVANRLDERVEEYSKASTEEYESVSRLMMIVAAIGIAVGLSFGFLIGQFGIAKPIRTLVALLQRMAKGEEVEITGTERKDEIGDTANAVNGIKAMLAEKARLEAEQKAEQEKKLAADREAAAKKMADEFEAAVGGIVQAAVAGDFSQRVDLQGKSGLVLNVGTAINSLCENVAKALDDLVHMLNALAEGNLTQRITAEYQGNFALLKENANTTADRIGSTIAEIKSSAREVTNASAEISTSSTDLSQRTEEQAASLEETSASMEQISATVKKNADNAQVANQSAAETREVAERGGQVVAQAVDAMARIEESSRKISDLRYHRGHRRDRPPDQSSGAQRRGGGGARRRRRPRLRGGGVGSADAGAALVAGGQGHQGSDHQQQQSGQGRRRSGQQSGRGADRNRQIDQGGVGRRGRDRQCQRRTGERHRAGQQGAGPDGRGDAAELGAGGGERGHRQDLGASGQCDGPARRRVPGCRYGRAGKIGFARCPGP
jgi:methyl-accepting chemotaxis protein